MLKIYNMFKSQEKIMGMFNMLNLYNMFNLDNIINIILKLM